MAIVDVGTLPFVNFSAPGTSGEGYLSSSLHSQAALWDVPAQTSIWDGTLTVTGSCSSGSHPHSNTLPAYFLLQPATYNIIENVTYPPFFVLASYSSSFIKCFNPVTYRGDKDRDNINNVYITSAIQWQDESLEQGSNLSYYIDEWELSVAADGSLAGSCEMTDTAHMNPDTCVSLNFPVDDVKQSAAVTPPPIRTASKKLSSRQDQ